jgi:pyruvate formate lyase activating enzyme
LVYLASDLSRTPPGTCQRARDQARAHGIHHVFSGNIHDETGQSTYCPGCGELLIQRDWYALGTYRLDGNKCEGCGTSIAGRFSEAGPEGWGRRRQPIAIR